MLVSDHEHKRGGREQPERRRDSMYMNYQGNGRLLMEVVVQIETKADAHKYPEETEPDQRSPAIFTRRPCCCRMDAHSPYPWQSEKHIAMERMANAKQQNQQRSQSCTLKTIAHTKVKPANPRSAATPATDQGNKPASIQSDCEVYTINQHSHPRNPERVILYPIHFGPLPERSEQKAKPQSDRGFRLRACGSQGCRRKADFSRLIYS